MRRLEDVHDREEIGESDRAPAPGQPRDLDVWVALEDCYRMLFAIGAQPDARTRVLARHLGRDDSAPPTGRTAVAG